MSPLRLETTTEASEGTWSLVGKGGKAVSPPKSHSPQQQNKASQHTVPWVLITLFSVLGKIPDNKAHEVGQAFTKFIGNAFCHQIINKDRKDRKSLTFKILETKLTIADNFGYEKFNFKVKKSPSKRNKQAKGIIKLTSVDNFESFQTRLKQDNPEILDIHRGYQYKDNKKMPAPTATITFRTEQAPIKLTNTQEIITPALLKPLRCNKCQMHGHTTKKCRSTIKCPHCAEPHSHNQCKNIELKKCANCAGKHSAAFKGCPAYLAYHNNITNTNNILTSEHQTKCERLGINHHPQIEPLTQCNKPPQYQKTNKSKQELINEIAPLLANKSQDEIKVILNNKLGHIHIAQTKKIPNKQTDDQTQLTQNKNNTSGAKNCTTPQNKTTPPPPQTKNNTKNTATPAPTSNPKIVPNYRIAPRYYNTQHHSQYHQSWKAPPYPNYRNVYGLPHPHEMHTFQGPFWGWQNYYGQGNRY